MTDTWKVCESGTPQCGDAVVDLAAAAGPTATAAGYPPLRKVAEKLAELSRLALEEASRVDATGEFCPPSSEPPAVAHVRGVPQINDAINTALKQAKKEILTAQPDGARPGLVLDSALESVRRHIARGVTMRTLYQHTARFDEATKNYVRKVTEYGVQVRTLEEFFDRLIVIDSTVAFIAADDARTTAAAIREPAVVRFLRDIFERAWDRAEPFPFIPLYAAEAAREVIPAIRESIRRLLIEGYSDKVIARRLGISERSLQAHVAAIKKELRARNRLQLGYLLGRKETTLML